MWYNNTFWCFPDILPKLVKFHKYNMSTSEEKILSTWLLVPASLQSVMTLGAFTRLFPTSQANNPQIRRLYRDLQHQRASLVDSIERNIEAEAAYGNAQKRSVLKVRRGLVKEELDEEVDIEYAVRLLLFCMISYESNSYSYMVLLPTCRMQSRILYLVSYQSLRSQRKIWMLRYSVWTRKHKSFCRRSRLSSEAWVIFCMESLQREIWEKKSWEVLRVYKRLVTDDGFLSLSILTHITILTMLQRERLGKALWYPGIRIACYCKTFLPYVHWMIREYEPASLLPMRPHSNSCQDSRLILAKLIVSEGFEKMNQNLYVQVNPHTWYSLYPSYVRRQKTPRSVES